MNKFLNFFTVILLLLGAIIIFGILISGCDKIRCSPQFNLDGTYIGISCGGEF